jgi:hypothetical protein
VDREIQGKESRHGKQGAFTGKGNRTRLGRQGKERRIGRAGQGKAARQYMARLCALACKGKSRRRGSAGQLIAPRQDREMQGKVRRQRMAKHGAKAG